MKNSDSEINKLKSLLSMKPFHAFLLVFSFILIPMLSSAKDAMHDFEGKCYTCHLSLGEGKKIFVKEIDFLCKRCHKDLGVSHPSGMKPSMQTPDKLPLDWGGRMTCTTCHNIHGSGKYLMRMGKPNRAFCSMCHKKITGRAAQPAHSASKKSLDVMYYEVTNAGSPIDWISIECLKCHGNIFGGSSNAALGAGIWNHGNGQSHPIGMNYMQAYLKGGLKHPSNMSTPLRFFLGKMGCGTCHNFMEKGKWSLVINNKDNALCLTCHIK